MAAPIPIRLGISTCPNDTFAFHALIEREVDGRGLDFRIELADVEELNRKVAAGALDVAKVSFHAALALRDELVVLPSGSALGFGVGPLVLAAPGQANALGSGARPRVLLPGEHTTATLLWRAFHPGAADEEHVRFSAIMPALQASRAELGVCIHEGRFTWRESGLELVEDLGATWEAAERCALPLGGIVGRRALGAEVLARAQAAIADSIDWALAHREACLPTMRAHAQELADDVIWQHVDLYVNAWTRELGGEGRAALAALERRWLAGRGEPAEAAGARLEVLA